MRGKLALVTGANGFLGRHVARYFHRLGAEVTGLGHGAWSRDEWEQWGIKEWHAGDVNLDNLLVYAGEPDLIIHCAGSGSVGFSITHPAQDYRRTVDGTLHVLEFIRLHSPNSRIIYPSSAGVYGSVNVSPIPETCELNPASPYGVHKMIAEELCRSYARHFSVRAAIIRFFSLYGPELRKQLFWDVCRKVHVGEAQFAGTGRETRDWLHVDDGVRLIHSAADRASTDCPIVNGGSGVALAVRSVIEEIIQLFECGMEPRFSMQARPGDPVNYCADIGQALSWGWKPEMDWRSGLRGYVEWYRRELL